VLGLFATIRGAAKERELARLKSDFVSTVSHELKTPLTSIRMFAEMLQQGVAGEDRDRERRYHDIIVKESERLGLLIANLLDYAQIERGTRRYNRKLEPAGQLAQEAVTTFARLREGEGQAVELSSADPASYPGIYGVFPLILSIPGPDAGVRQVPCAGLTWVGVHPDHRRKGVLSAMLRHHFEQVHEEQGTHVSALHASEPAIYGRHGYGLASQELEVSLGRGTTSPRPSCSTRPTRSPPSWRR